VPGDDGGGVQRGQPIERGDPFGPPVGGRRAEVHVAMVVGDVPGDDQAQVGHVQRGRVQGVGVPGFNHLDGGALKLDFWRLEWLGQRDRVGDLTGEPRPEGVIQRLGVLLLHVPYRLRRGDRPRVREAVEHDRQAEIMVAMAVRDVDGGEPTIVQRHPASQGSGLAHGHQRVHEHGIARAEDQRRRRWVPGPRVAHCGRRGDERLFRRGKDVVAQRGSGGWHMFPYRGRGPWNRTCRICVVPSQPGITGTCT
jgi:hypothetical protein